jgi:hypothetical protein
VIRKFIRLALVASVAAGFGVAPMLTAPAYADSGVDVWNPPRGFDSGGVDKPHETKIYVHDSVTWYIREGTHNVTPAEDVANAQKWGQKASADLAVGDPDFVVKFDKPGLYFYFSSVNGEGKDDKGHLSGMSGVVNVIDPNATTTTTAPPTTTTTTTAPPTPDTTPHPGPSVTTPTTASAPAGVAGHVPTTAAPAPTTTTPTKPDKKPKDGSTTTTTAAPVSGPIDLSAEAIVPNVTPNGTATQDGVVQPSSTLEGQAAAVVKQKHGHKGMLVLVATGLGIGALGIGAAGYKYANRSSKYFPA